MHSRSAAVPLAASRVRADARVGVPQRPLVAPQAAPRDATQHEDPRVVACKRQAGGVDVLRQQLIRLAKQLPSKRHGSPVGDDRVLNVQVNLGASSSWWIRPGRHAGCMLPGRERAGTQVMFGGTPNAVPPLFRMVTSAKS
jgi:hypothetical protein